MKKNVKIIQFSLLSIGLILLLSVYFLYPIINKKNLKEESSVDKIETEKEKIDSETSTEFVNVEYNGESAGSVFTVKAEKAKITDDVNLISMKYMLVTIFLNDEKWIIECALGTYNKLNYDVFCTKDVKATNEKITVLNHCYHSAKSK